MAHQPQALRRILAGDATLAAWDARRRRDEELVALVRRLLPRLLAPSVRVADVRDGELELAAQSGAAAAVIRQRTRELMAGLQSQGWQFTGIRIRVQVGGSRGPENKPAFNQIDKASLRPLAQLAGELPVGLLKNALEKFLRATR